MEATWPDGVSGTVSLEEPKVYRFRKFVDESFIEVEDVEYSDAIVVPSMYLPEVAAKRFQLLQKKIKVLERPPLAFSVGQQVRFRKDGHLENGKVVGVIGFDILISAHGKIDTVSRTRVFHRVAGEARNHFLPKRIIRLCDPTGNGLKFLDAVANWTSQPEFRTQTARQQITLLAKLVVAFMPWNSCGQDIDRTRAVDLTDLLSQGVGVCRHLAAVTALVMNETGFPARMWSAVDHMWVEMDDLIIDPSVRSMNNAIRVKTRHELANENKLREQSLYKQILSKPEPQGGDYLVRLTPYGGWRIATTDDSLSAVHDLRRFLSTDMPTSLISSIIFLLKALGHRAYDW